MTFVFILLIILVTFYFCDIFFLVFVFAIIAKDKNRKFLLVSFLMFIFIYLFGCDGSSL